MKFLENFEFFIFKGFSSQIEDEVEQIRDLTNFNSENVTDFNTVGLADIEFAVKVLKIFLNFIHIKSHIKNTSLFWELETPHINKVFLFRGGRKNIYCW